MAKRKAKPRNWFALWNLPQRTWAVIAAAVPALYFLSAAPLIYVLIRWAKIMPDSVFMVLMLLAFPAVSLAAENDLLGFIFDCEFSLLMAIFGPVGAADPVSGN